MAIDHLIQWHKNCDTDYDVIGLDLSKLAGEVEVPNLPKCIFLSDPSPIIGNACQPEAQKPG